MPNEFKPSVGNKVPKKEAEKWIKKYDQEMRKDKNTDTQSIFYGRDVLLKILSVDGSTGITFFLAMKYNEIAKKEIVQLVLVPTREDGSLIWPDDAEEGAIALRTEDGGSYDSGAPCPPTCR